MKQSPRARVSRIAGLTVALACVAAAQTPATKPSSPSVVSPPVWSRVFPMPDGRTFVTDGGLSIDARLAKPAVLPSVVFPPEAGKNLAGRLSEAYDREIALADLRPGTFPNSFTTPDGIALNGNYVAFLRRVASPTKTRLRTRGKMDPVVVVTDGEAIAIMMPLATPSR